MTHSMHKTAIILASAAAVAIGFALVARLHSPRDLTATFVSIDPSVAASLSGIPRGLDPSLSPFNVYATFVLRNISHRTISLTRAEIQTNTPHGWKLLYEATPIQLFASTLDPDSGSNDLRSGMHRSVAIQWPKTRPCRVCFHYDAESTGLASIPRRLRLAWRIRHFPPPRVPMWAPAGEAFSDEVKQ